MYLLNNPWTPGSAKTKIWPGVGYVALTDVVTIKEQTIILQGMIMVTVDIVTGSIMMITMKTIIKDNISREWIGSMQKKCAHTANKLTG